MDNIEVKESVQFVLKREKKFSYQILSRLVADCKYFLGNGNRYEKHLWGLTVKDHIESMKEIWNSFSVEEKPEWLSWNDILEFERQMEEGR